MNNTPTEQTIMNREVYVLKCQQGKYYIGETYNREKRINDHFNGSGAEWTQKYKPIRVMEVISADATTENIYTKRYMKMYGIENVRGGAYCQMLLPEYQQRALKQEFLSEEGRCYKCGQKGHYVSKCNNSLGKNNLETDWSLVNNNTTCYRCGRHGHYAYECRTVTGYKCGQKGHYTDECRLNLHSKEKGNKKKSSSEKSSGCVIQ